MALRDFGLVGVFGLICVVIVVSTVIVDEYNEANFKEALNEIDKDIKLDMLNESISLEKKLYIIQITCKSDKFTEHGTEKCERHFINKYLLYKGKWT